MVGSSFSRSLHHPKPKAQSFAQKIQRERTTYKKKESTFLFVSTCYLLLFTPHPLVKCLSLYSSFLWSETTVARVRERRKQNVRILKKMREKEATLSVYLT
jgi:hypothetical protein